DQGKIDACAPDAATGSARAGRFGRRAHSQIFRSARPADDVKTAGASVATANLPKAGRAAAYTAVRFAVAAVDDTSARSPAENKIAGPNYSDSRSENFHSESGRAGEIRGSRRTDRI